MWLWIGTGLGAFFAVSALVGAALAAMLGAISRGVTELHEELEETRAAGRPTAQLSGSRRRRAALALWT
jgi:hypothetical protein